MFFLPIMMLALFGAIQYGCEEEADEICQSFDAQCNAPDMAITCCTDAECYYEYEGVSYPNDQEGMADLIAAMCGTDEEDETTASVIEIEARLKAQTQKLLAEARSDAICN